MMAATNMTRRPTADVSADVEIIKYKDGAMGGKKSPEYNLSHMSVEFTDDARRRTSAERRQSPDINAPIYGELVVLGTNGCLPCQPISHKMKHSFVLRKQPKATGVSPIIRDQRDWESLSRKSTHTVTLQKTGHVTEYGHDPTTDLFQIGRSADSAIDLVVVETVTGPDGKRTYRSNSTVSRYACRIQCERSPPYSARLFAAAFDTSGKIKLSSMAPSWKNRLGEYDGVTTNGVAFMRPVGVFESGVSPGGWKEATVNGHVRNMRAVRSARSPGEEVPEDTNMLTDGCLIDLCGVTLMWRTAIGLEQGPSNTILRSHRQELNEKAPQCPVNLLTLHFRGARSGMSTAQSGETEEREPWVYLKCGHLHSFHQWKAGPKESDSKRTCPVCREAGPYVRLELGQDRAFFIDSGPLSHAFVPCGHVTTEKTTEQDGKEIDNTSWSWDSFSFPSRLNDIFTRYWKSVQIPHLSNEWTSRCPFCTLPLDSQKPAVRLLFS